MTPTEEWRDVLGTSGRYRVSDRGRVFSVVSNKMLKPKVDEPYGRLWVNITAVRCGGYKSRRISSLVAEAFLPPPSDPSLELCHNDGDNQNNVPSNLRWDTSKANSEDMVRHGRAKNQNTDKTHCIRGHEYTPENTCPKPHPNGKVYRRCKICRDEESRTTYRKRLARLSGMAS